MTIYVILYPHSVSNPSGNYRVVDAADWVAFANGEKQIMPIAEECDSFHAAEAERDALNGKKAP